MYVGVDIESPSHVEVYRSKRIRLHLLGGFSGWKDDRGEKAMEKQGRQQTRQHINFTHICQKICAPRFCVIRRTVILHEESTWKMSHNASHVNGFRRGNADASFRIAVSFGPIRIRPRTALFSNFGWEQGQESTHHSPTKSNASSHQKTHQIASVSSTAITLKLKIMRFLLTGVNFTHWNNLIYYTPAVEINTFILNRNSE